MHTAKKSGPTDHPLGKPINQEASQPDRLKCRDKNNKALGVPMFLNLIIKSPRKTIHPRRAAAAFFGRLRILL